MEATIIVVFIAAVESAFLTTIMGLYLLLVVLAIYMWFQMKVDSTFKSNMSLLSFNNNHGVGLQRDFFFYN